MKIERPSVKPVNVFFSSGPCAKRPVWSIANLPTFTLGRSHRSKISKDDQAKAETAALKTAKHLWNFLSGIAQKHNLSIQAAA